MADGFAIVRADDVDDAYAGSDVPGEFRKLTDALGAEQLSVTLIRVPSHSDMEQSTGHTHSEIEELYIVAKGTITFRCDENVEKVTAPAVVRVSPGTARSHRNEGEEPVEIWAVSVKGHKDATKIDDFWEASPEAKQTR
jgi:mannose-6-phosphate isomerase-like protein (cupin superfamily)